MVCSSVRPIVRPFVRPNNLCSVVMLPKFRSFVRSIIQSFARSFIVPIHRSSFVHSHYSSFVYTTIHVTIQYRYYSPIQFIIVTIHVTIHRRYYSSMIYIFTISPVLFIIAIHRYYSSLLFIGHPITPKINYSSIMLSSSPKTCQTNIPVIRTPMTVIFLPVRTSHLVTHHRFLEVEHA
jgi:hypothetical protein